MAFRRKGSPGPSDESAPIAEAESQPLVDEAVMLSDRSRGPWDLSEVFDDFERVDFGGLRFAPREGLELQVQVDQESGRVLFVTAVMGQAAAQLHAFAAPRSGGLWDDVRREIRAGINASGGLVEEADGPFGVELRARVVQAPGAAMQPARFIGIDGPRWFLRAILLGDAAIPGDGAEAIESVVRDVVVVRGSGAMAPREQIPLHIPGQEQAAPVATVDPFVRGPEITEIR